jgi:TusA-related sulfurtransferase
MDEEIDADLEIDCVGLYCPMPISMTRAEIENVEIGRILKVEADDPAAEEDILRWAKRLGHEVVKFEKEDGILTFYIRRMK